MGGSQRTIHTSGGLVCRLAAISRHASSGHLLLFASHQLALGLRVRRDRGRGVLGGCGKGPLRTRPSKAHQPPHSFLDARWTDSAAHCCCTGVGIWQHDRVEIIPNEQGNRTTPSYVAFTDTERLIGDAAKNQVAMNPINTVFDAKRLIGRKFSDPAIQVGAGLAVWLPRH